jgi:hypothetical protein
MKLTSEQLDKMRKEVEVVDYSAAGYDRKDTAIITLKREIVGNYSWIHREQEHAEQLRNRATQVEKDVELKESETSTLIKALRTLEEEQEKENEQEG